MKKVLIDYKTFCNMNESFNVVKESLEDIDSVKYYKNNFPKFYKGFIEDLKYYSKRGFVSTPDISEFQDGYIPTIKPQGYEGEIKFHLFQVTKDLDKVQQSKGSLDELLEMDANSINEYLTKKGYSLVDAEQLKLRIKNEEEKYRNLGYNLYFKITDWPDVVKKSNWDYLVNMGLLYYKPLIGMIKEKESSSIKKENIELKDILNLPEYKELQKLGFYSTTTPQIWKNGNFRITHPILDYGAGFTVGEEGRDVITIYSNGPVRLTSNGRPAMITSAPGFNLNTKEDWSKKLEWVNGFVKRKILKDAFDIRDKASQEKLAKADFSNDRFLVDLADIKEKEFKEFLEKMKADEKSIDGIVSNKTLIKSLAMDNPEATARFFKDYAKRKEIQEVANELPQKTQEEFKYALEILWDLSSLGF